MGYINFGTSLKMALNTCWFLFCVGFLGIMFISFISAGNIFKYTVPINDSILLTGCRANGKDRFHWKFQERLLFMDGFIMRGDLSSSVVLLQNSSVNILSTSLSHAGKYECFKNDRPFLTYIIEVEGL